MAQLKSIQFEAVVRKRNTVAEYSTATLTTRKMLPFVGKKVLVIVMEAKNEGKT